MFLTNNTTLKVGAVQDGVEAAHRTTLTDTVKPKFTLPSGKYLRALAPNLLPYILLTVLLITLARPTLDWWFFEYTKPESYYQHGLLIPFMSAFMLWHVRSSVAAAPKKPTLWPLLVFLPALALYVVSIKIEMRAIQSLTFMLMIWSSVWAALGTKLVKVAWLPLAFLSLMMPLPGLALNEATQGLQMTSTVLASKILTLFGFANTHLGNVISMDNFMLWVDVPCSGFKTLLALLTFNAFFAYMLDGPVWKRVALFCLCAPLALLVNAVRIALIGVVGECISSEAAHVFHDYSGPITLTLGFILLFSIAKVLGCKKFAGWDIF